MTPTRLIAVTSLIVLLVVMLLSVYLHLSVEELITKQSKYATLINVSGEQRMLSQRAALFTTRHIFSGTAESKALARESIARLAENHRFLLNAHNEALDTGENSPLSKELSVLYFSEPVNINVKITQYIRFIQSALNNELKDSSATLAGLTEFSQTILTNFDNVVKQYERESQNEVERLRLIQRLSVLVVILLALCQIFLITRPLLALSEEHTEKLEDEANKDHLTGLLNRRSFELLAQQNIALSKRDKTPLSLMLVDIDLFKQCNDEFGHAYGDKVLQFLANLMQCHTRSSDIIFRFGGDEFVILLPNTPSQDACVLAKKIYEESVRQSKQSMDWKNIIKLSIGIAEYFTSESSLEPALKRADEAMYQCKGGVQAQVQLWNPLVKDKNTNHKEES